MDTASDSIKQSVPNRYSLVVLAAKRAKQIREGAPLLIDTDSVNSLTVALEEIAAGKIEVIEAVEAPARDSTAPSGVAAAPTAMQMLDASLAEAERAARPAEAEAAADRADHKGVADEDEEVGDGDEGEQADGDAELDEYAEATTSAAAEE